jgi:aspartyl-tRNA(Asn)/glutamyl-tRNA(Gln) amidotransferase subunit A
LNDEAKEMFEQGKAWLKDAGATFVEISLPTTPYALPTYYILAPAEASANLARYDGLKYGVREEGKSLDEMYENTRRSGFGDEVRRRIMIGTYVLSAGYYDAYYLKAQKIQTLIAQDFERAFKNVDVIFTPTTPTAAFAIGEEAFNDPIAMYQNDIFTVTANIAGLPGISVPAGLSKDGLPLGLQLIGPKLSEQRLFNTSLVIEKAADFRNLTSSIRKGF